MMVVGVRGNGDDDGDDKGLRCLVRAAQQGGKAALPVAFGGGSADSVGETRT